MEKKTSGQEGSNSLIVLRNVQSFEHVRTTLLGRMKHQVGSLLFSDVGSLFCESGRDYLRLIAY